MQPGALTLTPGKAAQFVGSDGRLEVDVPATAVSATDLSQAGGALTLQITQIAPASGGNAGGWGLISFGTYLLQLVDAQGQPVPHGFRVPITLKWHYQPQESALDLAHAFAVFNAARCLWRPGPLHGGPECGGIDHEPDDQCPPRARRVQATRRLDVQQRRGQ
jgi:hypothetical protein